MLVEWNELGLLNGGQEVFNHLLNADFIYHAFRSSKDIILSAGIIFKVHLSLPIFMGVSCPFCNNIITLDAYFCSKCFFFRSWSHLTHTLLFWTVCRTNKQNIIRHCYLGHTVRLPKTRYLKEIVVKWHMADIHILLSIIERALYSQMYTTMIS